MNICNKISTSSLPPVYVITGLLTVLAVFNYVTGVYGGAIISAVGAMIASLFGLLSN